MAVQATVLFGKPQQEIATRIARMMSTSTATSIITGFATSGGVEAIADSIKANPGSIRSIIVGAATYPGFAALDDLIDAGVPADRLFVHLGHSSPSGTFKNPFVRFHPMLHTKIYYMELPGDRACAFIGSHNVTTYALGGLNGEAAVLLEGPLNSAEFDSVRAHIDEARAQSAVYSPDMKEGFAWWTREFIEGMRAEVAIPVDWQTVRTILVFATSATGKLPSVGDEIYFEIPAGIEQIEALKTEMHLFIFNTLPTNPWDAIVSAGSAVGRFTCMTIGADNKQGNRVVDADWQIDGSPPVLRRVPGGQLQLATPGGKQQVRAEVQSVGTVPYEYRFDRQKMSWSPIFSNDVTLSVASGAVQGHSAFSEEARGRRGVQTWRLVKALAPGDGVGREKDAVALRMMSPESGSLMLVSLRRRHARQRSAE